MAADKAVKLSEACPKPEIMGFTEVPALRSGRFHAGEEAVEYCVNHSEASILFVSNANWAKLAKSLSKLDAVHTVVFFGSEVDRTVYFSSYFHICFLRCSTDRPISTSTVRTLRRNVVLGGKAHLKAIYISCLSSKLFQRLPELQVQMVLCAKMS